MGSAQDSFEATAQDFSLHFTKDEVNDFRNTTVDDVCRVIMAMRGYSSQRGSLKSKRLETYIDAMQQYSNVVMIFANSSSFLSIIWGSMKVLLQTASIYVEALEKLFGMYEQIGNCLPRFSQYSALFAGDSQMGVILALIYRDIVYFHRRALKIFRQKSLKLIFYATWKGFQATLENLLENLKRHKSLIESKATRFEIERSQVLRDTQETKFLEAEKAETKKQVFAIITKISPASVSTDQEKCEKNWKKVPNFGSWLLNNEKMEAWFDATNVEGNLLWLRGNPGSGKTILASRVIAACRSSKNGHVALFYCQQEDPLRDSLGAVLRGLLAQLIRLNPGVTSYVYEECSQSSELVLESLEVLKTLTEIALESTRPTWIVLDGLDECNKKERKQIITWAVALAKSNERQGRLRFLFVSQDEADLRKLLSHIPSLCLDEIPQHQEELKAYTSRKLIKLKQKFDMPKETELEIVEKVMRHANGMFLFARLVLNHLKNQESLVQLQGELEPSRFPTTVDELVKRIYSNKALPERDVAEEMRLSHTNRSLLESVAKLQDRRNLPENKETRLSRRVGDSCEACHLLKFHDQHLKIPLIKLLISSISCQICHTLCKAVRILDQEWLAIRHSSSVLDIERSRDTICFQVRMLEAMSGYRGEEETSPWGFPLTMHLFAQNPLEGSWSTLQIHDPIAQHSASDECFNKISEWLYACENEHLHCSRAQRPSQDGIQGGLAAARVIDLGTSDKIYPRLTTTSATILRWTALSYCWGGGSTFVTTESNIEERQRGIPWSSIPATFKDAMRLTHRLGIRYIWIDALCIMQDSPTDWSTEAGKMGSIYQNAQLVIAADLAVNCSSGIFASRERYSIPLEEVDSGCSEASQMRQHIYLEKGSSKDYTSQRSEPSEWHTGSHLRHSVLESNSKALNKRWLNPTLRRAWCFQERMLATRIIHYTAAEVIWECKTKIDCECGIRNFSNDTLKQSLDSCMSKATTLEYPEFTLSRDTSSKMWWTLVVEYSRCDLTNISDRLPAISGLARLFPQLGEYWAGMWSKELPLSLLWRESPQESRKGEGEPANDVYVAPSWSWASAVDPIVGPDMRYTKMVAEVLNVRETPTSADPYGQIRDAHLVLRGPVHKGVLRSFNSNWFGKPVIQLKIVHDDGGTIPGMDYDGLNLSFQEDHRVRLGGEGEFTGAVLCLAVKSTTSAEHGTIFDCLVLHMSGAEEGAYERVGLVTCVTAPDSRGVFTSMAAVTII